MHVFIKISTAKVERRLPDTITYGFQYITLFTDAWLVAILTPALKTA